MARAIVLSTFDGDPGVGFTSWRPGAAGMDARQRYEDAVRTLFGALDRAGLRGLATWFLNELDVEWSARHAPLVREMSARGDAVALHTHFEGFFGAPTIDTEEDFVRICGEAKRRLEAVSGRPCVAHRSGCCLQREYVYRALDRIGIHMLSDVHPGFCRETAAKIHLDNSMIPRGAPPYRHDLANWLDWRSQTGRFLHAPLAPVSLKDLASLPDRMKADGAAVACWDIHPHELQGPDGRVEPALLEAFSRGLERIETELSPAYCTFEGLPDLLRGSPAARPGGLQG